MSRTPKKSELAREDKNSPFGFTNPPDILIECEAFQGSLGMLFHCVREHKIDLLGIPLAPICEAYFQYILKNAHQDIESSATAMTALAYLLERKAWALLPKPEVEEPEVDDLMDEIEPYVHEFAPAIEVLKTLHDERGKVFFRQSEGEQYELPFELGEATVIDLARVLERLLAKAKPDTVEPIGKPRRSLSDQMIIVLKALPADFSPLDEVVVGEFTRSEVVWWFLALLELIRLGQARVRMEEGEPYFARAAHQ